MTGSRSSSASRRAGGVSLVLWLRKSSNTRGELVLDYESPFNRLTKHRLLRLLCESIPNSFCVLGVHVSLCSLGFLWFAVRLLE